MGAIGEGGVRVLNTAVVHAAHATTQELGAVEEAERAELKRRAARFRGSWQRLSLRGKTALLVDDGVATGATAKAACQVARTQDAARVVLAVPVGVPSAIAELREQADEVVCLAMPEWFLAVGAWYERFEQTSDEHVVDLLARAPHPPAAVADPPVRDDDLQVFAGSVPLQGHLTISERPVGLVSFAHGGGSSRYSPRNRRVARVLGDAGLATLLFDLLSLSEESDRERVFDVELLANRLAEVTEWVHQQQWSAICRHLFRQMPTRCFGAVLSVSRNPFRDR